MISADRPYWLLLLPILAVGFWFIQARGLSAVSLRQRRVALGIRIALSALLVFALAGARLDRSGDRIAVVFLVDGSDSVGPGGVDRAVDFVSEAVRAKRRGDLVAVVAFGREPRLEFSMTDRPEIQRLAATPDASATDLTRALRLAAALFPEGTKRRIVVLTDGRETQGDARREAERLAREGIRIDGLTITPSAGGDTLVESLEAPSRVRRGDAYRLALTLRSTGGGPAHVEVFRDGRIILKQNLTLKAGRLTIPIGERATEPGVHRYEARITAATDSVPQNNRGTTVVLVEGPPRVLLLEGKEGEADALAAALRAGRTEVDVRRPSDLPALGDLLSYEATVLVDVPVDALLAEQVATLKAAVTEAGAGLVTIGGEDAYGLGGYRGSDLESILPVDSDIKDPKRMPSVAEAIVIDTSGSMGRCHCRGGAMGAGPAGEGGLNKTDISRAGAARAIRALSKDDYVGVLAFNTESKWVVPMQKLPPEELVRSGLQRMQAAGGTNIPQALRTAVAELKQTKTKLKHIILFTDGWTNQSELVGVANEVTKAGITLSVVATGEGTGDVLAKMAEAGRGRFYAGTNLTDVPQVMMQEAILASRNFINEGVYRAVVSAETPITEKLSSAPPLFGYVATSLKSTATADLTIGQEDPLLATWRAGLGTVASWTSDSKPRWSRQWVGWEGFRDFWTRVVRSTFAPAGAGGFGLEARVSGDRLTVEVGSDRALPEGTTATARIVDPSLHTTEIELDRAGAGSFRGETPAGEEGAYLVAVTVRDGSAVLFRGRSAATAAYSAEYLATGSDETLVRDLARIGRGRAPVRPAQAFNPQGLVSSSARTELWPLLAVLAALLLPVDIAARRLVVSRADLRKGIASLRARGFRRKKGSQEREERIDRLMEAKARAREKYTPGERDLLPAEDNRASPGSDDAAPDADGPDGLR